MNRSDDTLRVSSDKKHGISSRAAHRRSWTRRTVAKKASGLGSCSDLDRQNVPSRGLNFSHPMNVPTLTRRDFLAKSSVGLAMATALRPTPPAAAAEGGPAGYTA